MPHDTKALVDGILSLVQKTEALQLTDAALDCRVTKLEIRVSGLAPRTRKRKWGAAGPSPQGPSGASALGNCHSPVYSGARSTSWVTTPSFFTMSFPR